MLTRRKILEVRKDPVGQRNIEYLKLGRIDSISLLLTGLHKIKSYD